MNEFIPVNQPLLEGNEKKYLEECIDSGWISSEGPFVQKFEDTFSNYCNRKYGIAVCNGSVALELAVKALGIEFGDEVIMPSFTIISCASAIVRAGGIPVLVDCQPDTWNMQTSQIEKFITKRTKAIMVVHIYGLPTKMDEVLAIAKKHNLFIIEDAAEAHGLKYNQKICGSFGDISIFSFYPNKHITTGEGGMVLTNDPLLAERCRLLKNLCFQPYRRFFHEELGWNFRMTNLQAAVGLAQLERIDLFIEKKIQMGKLYTELLSNVEEIQIPVKETSYSKNIYWVFGIVLTEKVGFNAFDAMEKLKNLGIGTRPFFIGMHQQPVFHKLGLFKDIQMPVTENISERGFYLPSGLALSEEQIFKSANALKSILK